ncbi:MULTISPECIES: BON domain-containing protein [unclassified Simplicispira]|jgi:osmotically-inducible protein OsmY|uniref:BON domain-containing protein n=1 Tax=unclassified Simplicispira TaxID=2630407 RepID=UPI000D5FCB51|nr:MULTISPECIES: BON domain-containing protein [unclassified Simplicispira]PVY55610.1 osmotically-inducible protein OsmY [Simplicispira sp. 125]REG16553.1 osmotically-inducible protein OsmY [Simplicispira sp. 110]
MNNEHFSYRAAQRIATVVAVSALAFGLVACDKPQDATLGQKIDNAVEKTEQAAQDAKVKAEQAAQDAKVQGEKAMQSAEKGLEKAGDKMEAAAQEAGAMARDAASSAATLASDAGITAQVKAGLAKDSDLSALKIDVDTRSGVVTLNGTAPSDAARERAAAIAREVKGVTSVINHLTV